MDNKKNDRLPIIPYLSLHHLLRSNILYTASWLKNELSMATDEMLGITLPKARILLALSDRGDKPTSTKELSEKMIDIGSDVPKLVDRMVLRGFIKKEASKTDKRLVHVTLTSAGKAMLDRIIEASPTFDKVTSNMLSDEEADTLNTLLSKMRGHKEEYDKLIKKPTAKGKTKK